MLGKGGQGCVFRLPQPHSEMAIKIIQLDGEEFVEQAALEAQMQVRLQQTPGIVTSQSTYAVWTAPLELLGTTHGSLFANMDQPRLLLVQEMPFIAGTTVRNMVKKVSDSFLHSSSHQIDVICKTNSSQIISRIIL